MYTCTQTNIWNICLLVWIMEGIQRYLVLFTIKSLILTKLFLFKMQIPPLILQKANYQKDSFAAVIKR